MTMQWTLVLMVLGALAQENPARAQPTSMAFLSPSEKKDGELRSLRDTARSVLVTKGISLEEVEFGCAPDSECIGEALGAARASVGLYVWLWEATENRTQPIVGVMIKDERGVAGFDEVAEERPCAPSVCATVVEELVEHVLVRFPERLGTRVSLTGTPKGATVFDGANLIGTVPGEFRLTRGEHRLRVMSKGYEPEVVLVHAGPSPAQKRRVDLVPKAKGTEPVDERRDRTRVALMASGVALLAGGGVLIGLGGASYARSDGCEGTVVCEGYTTGGPRGGVMLGLGAASVGGGLALLIKGIRKR